MVTQGFNETKDKSDKIASILRDVSVLIGKRNDKDTILENGGSIVPGLDFHSDAITLAKRAQDIQQGIFNIIVLGEFKHGKSTLLNSMIGGKTLPAKSTPCTAIITVLVHGEDNHVAVYEANKEKPRILTWDAFKAEYQLTKEDQDTLDKQGYIDRFQNIEYAQIQCQNSLCANGVKLVDSPGLKENISRTRVTTKFLKQSHAVIFVLNATQILSEDERTFIQTFFEPGNVNNVFFIVNRINLIDEEEVDEIKDYVKSGLKKLFINKNGQFDEKFYNRRVFYVDAKGALDARLSTPVNQISLESSGVPDFERELENFLTSPGKTTAAFSSTVQMLSWIVSQSREKIDQEKASLEQPLSELEKRRLETEKMLRELEDNKRDIEQTIKSYGGMIKQKIYANLIGHINEMEESWETNGKKMIKINNYLIFEVIHSFFDKDKKEKFSEAIAKETENYIRLNLEEWSKKIPTIIDSDVKSMMGEVEAQVGNFQLSLDKIRNVFSGSKAEEVIDVDRERATKFLQIIIGLGDFSQMTGSIIGKGDWGSFILRMITQAIILDFILTVATGGWAFIAIILAELIHIGIQNESLKAKLLEKLGKNIHTKLRQELSHKEYEIYSIVEKQFLELAQNITNNLQEQINEIRAEQDRIIHQKQDQSFSAEQEKQRLDSISQKIVELFNQASLLTYGKQLTPEEIESMAKGKDLLMVG